MLPSPKAQSARPGHRAPKYRGSAVNGAVTDTALRHRPLVDATSAPVLVLVYWPMADDVARG
eukprot:2600118-Prymnesium_polylepis.1